MKLFFTAMHLLDFQREFEIGGCVFINRNIVIIISRPFVENKKQKKPQVKICWKGIKWLFVTHYILCKL